MAALPNYPTRLIAPISLAFRAARPPTPCKHFGVTGDHAMPSKPKPINLALSGRWRAWRFHLGACSTRLLDAPEIEIAGISGTSAGALNGGPRSRAGLGQKRQPRCRRAGQSRMALGTGGCPDRCAPCPLARGDRPQCRQRRDLRPFAASFAIGDGLGRMVSPPPMLSGPLYSKPAGADRRTLPL